MVNDKEKQRSYLRPLSPPPRLSPPSEKARSDQTPFAPEAMRVEQGGGMGGSFWNRIHPGDADLTLGVPRSGRTDKGRGPCKPSEVPLAQGGNITEMGKIITVYYSGLLKILRAFITYIMVLFYMQCKIIVY